MLLTSDNAASGVKEQTQQTSRSVIPTVLVCLAGIVACVAIFFMYQSKMRDLQTEVRAQMETDAKSVAESISKRLGRMYDGLDNISKMQGVRNMYATPTGLSEEDKETIEELYTQMYSSISLSEIYISPVDFDPRKLDTNTGEMQVPTITFDGHIADSARAEEVASNVDIAEIEVYEYEQMLKQLQWFKEYQPFQADSAMMQSSLLISGEVLTCDNSQYSLQDIGDANRMGLVFSVPIYNVDDKLSGLVSGVLLTNVVRSLLPSTHYSIRNIQDVSTIHAMDTGIAGAQNTTAMDKNGADQRPFYANYYKLSIAGVDTDWELGVRYTTQEYFQNPQVTGTQHKYLIIVLVTIIITGVVSWLTAKR